MKSITALFFLTLAIPHLRLSADYHCRQQLGISKQAVIGYGATLYSMRRCAQDYEHREQKRRFREANEARKALYRERTLRTSTH